MSGVPQGWLLGPLPIYQSIKTAAQNPAAHVTSEIKRFSSQIPVSCTVLSSFKSHANVLSIIRSHATLGGFTLEVLTLSSERRLTATSDVEL